MHNGKSSTGTGSQWQIALTPRQRAVGIDLTANDQLRWLPASGDGSWEATGKRPGLVLSQRALSRPLAAGWYELRGWLDVLEVEDGDNVLPSVCLHYADGSAMTDTELMLPEPDASGHIATLLMFFDDVESLEFRPAICSVRFRMHDFALRRVSRMRALRAMLGGLGGARRNGLARRLLTWGRKTMVRGLKRATDELYADYRKRVWPHGVDEYDLWIRKYDSFDRTALDAFRQHAMALADRGPLISVLLPVHDASESLLCRCLGSVLEQAWEQWELCVVDDAPTTSCVTGVLNDYARRDPRIRVTRSEHHDDASEVCNAALAMANGEFVVLLDLGDVLRPHALLRMTEAAGADPELAIAYSDEDKIDTDGKRSDPDFKPDWNPDLLRSRNYVGRLAAIRTTLVREAGGFRTGLEGSHDYDLLLRCAERVSQRQIHHIPEVLYHRHVGGASAICARAAKNFAAATDMSVVAEHLQRIGGGADVEMVDLSRGLCRVRWPLPQPAPKVSLIIPTRDRVGLLRLCVESILTKSTYPDFELVVVDNQSSDSAALNYMYELAACEHVRVLHYDAPFNYSAINNWAARQCNGQLLGFVNNDIEAISPGWLEEMAGFAVRPETGAVGAMLYYPDDTIQHAGMLLGVHGVAGHAYAGMPRGYPGYNARGLVAQNLSVVTGACMLVRREVFEAVGGLDERLPVEFNDIDFCLRVQRCGYRNVWTPFAEMYHHESASRAIGDASSKRTRSVGVAYMLARWGGSLREDPAYNPNLSLQSVNFELAFPPRGRPSDEPGWRDPS